MGVANTLPSFKSFTFDGENSRNYGVYITGKGVFNAPERNVEMVEIPGRNGAYALDKGYFNNIEVPYPAGIVAETEADFAEAVSNMRNFLCSRVGYVRLTDDYNPDEYRLAVYKSGLDVEHDALINGKFDLVFECKPQRWLKSGEDEITIGEWGETETYSGETVSFEATDSDAIKALTADIEPIQDLHGYDAPWVGGAGKNKYPVIISDDTWVASNANNSWSKDGDTVVVNCEGAQYRGAYSDPNNSEISKVIGTLSGTYTYSFDLKASVNCTARIGYEGGKGVKNISATTSWQRVTTTATFDSTKSAFIIYNMETTALTLYVKNFQIEQGSMATTYAPYENICPISGSASVTVYDTDEQYYSPSNTVIGKNWINGNDEKRAINKFNIVGGETYKVYTKGGNFSNILFIQMNGTSQITNRIIVSPTNENVTLDANCNNIIIQFEKATAITADDFNDFVCSVSKQLTTTTTQLGQTVYGGTLDVVSGVLTVTHGFITFNGSENWQASSNPNRYYVDYNSPNFDYKRSATTFAITNKYDFYGMASGSGNLSDGQFALYHNTQSAPNLREIMVYDASAVNVAGFKSALSSSNLQVCYELATPTTTQLTPQQVELLLGENNIFADSGNVTVEVGQNPSVLINPTQFDSEPLLAIDGYGTVGFNGYEIEIENATIGTVMVFDGFNRSVAEMPETSSVTLTLDTSSLEAGDEIAVDGVKETITATQIGYNITSLTINSVTGMTETHSYSGKVATFNTNIGAETIEFGTSKTWSAHLYASLGFVPSGGGSGSTTVSTFLDFSYDGNQTIIVTFRQRSSYAVKQSSAFSVPSLAGVSSRSIVTDTIHIDCEIGECYMVSDGGYVSLNSIIDLGSELPKLAHGNNIFTLDDTITDLKVTPRWWKV